VSFDLGHGKRPIYSFSLIFPTINCFPNRYSLLFLIHRKQKTNTYLFFESGFDKDVIKVTNDNEIILTKELISDPSTDFAGYSNVGSFTKFNHLIIHLNDGYKVLLEDD